MHIVHIAAELAPIAKVGGLADVLLGLTRELSCSGHDIDIIMPKYDCMDSDLVRDLVIDNANLMSFFEGDYFSNTIWCGWVENLKVYFIEPHHPRLFFKRGCFYGCHDDMERYLFFCRATIEFMYKKQLRPAIIHLHDWQTAVLAPLYYDVYNSLGFCQAKVVYTIHNLEYQGRCSPANLSKIGLDGRAYCTSDKLLDPLYPDVINLMKGGIVYSDYVTTVSPTYAKEIITPLGGRGLDSLLRFYNNKFKGILNGIDKNYWDPETDRYLPSHFSCREIPINKHDHNVLDKKGYLKRTLRERLLLAEEHSPIVSCIARLVPQKGTELIKHAISYIAKTTGQFILLGISPIPTIADEFHALRQTFADHPRISINLHHNEELSHLVFAGSDMIILPSIFEPCGLTQLIGLRYGTIPLVRRTGGLADTIFDVEFSDKSEQMRNGYCFDDPTIQAMETTLDRAISHWYEEPNSWHHLVVRAMKCDFSWTIPAEQYLEIYQQLAQRA